MPELQFMQLATSLRTPREAAGRAPAEREARGAPREARPRERSERAPRAERSRVARSAKAEGAEPYFRSDTSTTSRLTSPRTIAQRF